jgi:hypothetical protein
MTRACHAIEPVRLDGEVRLTPEEVDLVAAKLRVHQRPRQAVSVAEREHALLERRARERAPGLMLDEDCGERPAAPPPGARREQAAVEPEALGLVDGALERDAARRRPGRPACARAS